MAKFDSMEISCFYCGHKSASFDEEKEHREEHYKKMKEKANEHPKPSDKGE